MPADTEPVTMVLAPRPAHEALPWCRAMLDPALRAAVGTLPDALRGVAEFQFGWCDDAGDPTGNPSDTAAHSTLVLLAAEAAGSAPDVALPAAVALELIHGYVRLHDDVIEGGVRAGACSVYGTGPAILAGSALQTLAFDTLAAVGDARAREGMRLLSAALHELLDGRMTAHEQARQAPGVEQCSASARNAALLGCACALGELFATGTVRRTSEDESAKGQSSNSATDEE